MPKKILILCATAALMLGGPVFAADKGAAETAIAEAKAAGEVAKAAKGEWRDTAKMVKGAEDALAAGEFDEAVKLAGKAKFQYEAAEAQAKAETGVGNPGYLK